LAVPKVSHVMIVRRGVKDAPGSIVPHGGARALSGADGGLA
jgi:hypothetical protein